MGCCLWSRTESDIIEATQQQQQHAFRTHRMGLVSDLACMHDVWMWELDYKES